MGEIIERVKVPDAMPQGKKHERPRIVANAEAFKCSLIRRSWIGSRSAILNRM